MVYVLLGTLVHGLEHAQLREDALRHEIAKRVQSWGLVGHLRAALHLHMFFYREATKPRRLCALAASASSVNFSDSGVSTLVGAIFRHVPWLAA